MYTPELGMIHKEFRAINMQNTKNTIYSFAPEAVTVALLGRNLKASNSKFWFEVTMAGFPKLEPVDSQGEPTSFGELEQFKFGFEIEKASSVFSLMDIDKKSFEQVGTMSDIISGIKDVALDEYINLFSYILNHTHDGIFRTFGDEYPSMTNRGSDSLWSKVEADGSITNLAENLGSNVFGNAGIIDAKKKIRSHQTPYRTRVKANVLGAIVDRRQYDVAMDIVNPIATSDNASLKLSSRGLPIGVADFNNEQDWYLITDKTQIGFGYYPGYMFPQFRTFDDGLSNNTKIITEWFNKGYVARPTGYFYNKF